MLTECPESHYFMHAGLNLDETEARALANELANLWKPQRPCRVIRIKAQSAMKPLKLEPIIEVEEEQKEEFAIECARVNVKVQMLHEHAKAPHTDPTLAEGSASSAIGQVTKDEDLECEIEDIP